MRRQNLKRQKYNSQRSYVINHKSTKPFRRVKVYLVYLKTACGETAVSFTPLPLDSSGIRRGYALNCNWVCARELVWMQSRREKSLVPTGNRTRFSLCLARSPSPYQLSYAAYHMLRGDIQFHKVNAYETQ